MKDFLVLILATVVIILACALLGWAPYKNPADTPTYEERFGHKPDTVYQETLCEEKKYVVGRVIEIFILGTSSLDTTEVVFNAFNITEPVPNRIIVHFCDGTDFHTSLGEKDYWSELAR